MMHKGTRIYTMGEILKKGSQNGIFNLCFIFFGFPGETKKEARQTVEFLRKHADYIEDIIVQPFELYLRGPIGKDPEKWGIDIKGDGSYSVRSGMGPEEVNAFWFKFEEEVKIGSIKVTSDKLRYLFPGNNRRMLHFLNSSYNLLSKTVVLERLRAGKLKSIFPIILGEIKSKGERTMFWPINISESNFINEYVPVKEIVLDELKEKIFIPSDGTLSIEDIIGTICKNFKSYRKERVYKKCTEVFQNIFSKNWGLCFSKSWGVS